MTQIALERLAELGVPARTASLVASEGFEVRPAVLNATKAAHTGALVVLAGRPGTGKSVAAAAAAAECRTADRERRVHLAVDPSEPGAVENIVNGAFYVSKAIVIQGAALSGAWISAPSCFESIFNADFWTRARKAGVLVLDDLGLEVQDARVRDRLVGLMVERYDAMKATIVTTNLDRESFRTTYASGAGERLVRRVTWIQVAGAAPAAAGGAA